MSHSPPTEEHDAARRSAEFKCSVREFENLLQENLRVAYTVALRLCGSRDDAEDLLQEAAVQAFKNFGAYTSGTNFRAWFLKVLTNIFLNQRRRKQREPATTPIEDATDLYMYSMAKRAGCKPGGGDPAATLLERVSTAQIAEAIDSLPEEFSLAAWLYFVDELPYAEIAEILGCPVGTVRSRLHRGRKLLQKQLWELAEPHLASDSKARKRE